MKNLGIIFCFAIVSFFKSQTTYLEYDYYLKSPVENTIYHQVAQLTIDASRSHYELLPIDNMDEGFKESADGAFVIAKKDDFRYIQYSDGKSIFISDKLQGKQYFLKDAIPEMKWVLADESKAIEGTTLKKAFMSFRGRDYIAWFDPKIKAKFGPWKLQGLNFLIVEASSADGKVHWKLKTKPVSQKNEIKNPFSIIPENEFKPYSTYPSLAYGLSPALKEALSKNPNNTMFEQPRHQLEIKFEWED